jgi:hypothetical protein
MASGASYTNVSLRVLRDDGVLVYLNAAEIFRNNLPTGAVTSSTVATVNVSGAEESTLFLATNVNPALLRSGLNMVAAEIHQVNNTSPDISFDLELTGGGAVPDIPTFLHGDSIGGGQFRLWFEGQPGRTYVIESSPSLGAWSPISTNSPLNGQVEYIDVDATVGLRFFRARHVR